jgi:two-component system sensor histidine kinase VanS
LKTKDKKADYTAFQVKIMRRFCASAIFSCTFVIGLYLFLWKKRMGDWVVSLLQSWMGLGHEDAFLLYHNYFRGFREAFFAVAILLIFSLLLWYLFRWMTRYFKEINQGIDCLLAEQGENIRLSPEMLPFEVKLNTVKDILLQREREAKTAEQRKNELVVYLAHDIRTPLTSIIGYLNLLEQMPDLPDGEKAKYVHISLEKTYRLEQMINEFFEITRYNTQQIKLSKKPVDLRYLLEQVIDEHIPLFTNRGNYVTFQAEGPMEMCGDADKLARVFNNLLKNAAAYSEAGTEVIVTAKKTDVDNITVAVSTYGKPIPKDKLDILFDKFYRLDEARTSNTGGTGLGLAIVKEIVVLHGGTITADSSNGQTTFTVKLPVAEKS